MNTQKMVMNRQKKGMSPLIATVLLIGFAVALAALVMTWGLDFIKGQTGRVDDSTQQALLCVNELDFKIEVDCTGDKIFIDNRGSVEINELRLRKHLAGGGTVTPVQAAQPLLPGEKQEFTQLGDLANIEKIDVVATIPSKDGTPIVCNNALREVQSNCAP